MCSVEHPVSTQPDVQPEHSHNRPARCAASNTVVATQPDVQLEHSQNCEPKRCALKRYEATCCEPPCIEAQCGQLWTEALCIEALWTGTLWNEALCIESQWGQPLWTDCELNCYKPKKYVLIANAEAGWCWRGLHINLAAPLTHCRAFVAKLWTKMLGTEMLWVRRLWAEKLCQ